MNRYMLIFAALVLGGYLIALFAGRTPTRRLNMFNRPMPNPIGFLLPAAGFAVFSGLRNTLGDTDAYIHDYELLVEGFNEMEPIRFQFKGNTFFNFLEYELIRTNHDQPYMMLMITACLAVIPVIYILYKYSWPYELGIAFFVLTSYYTFSMNGIRQYAAAGLLILGTKYMLSEKWTDFFKYLPFVILAWLWHSTALIMIPIFFIVKRRAWTPLTVLILSGTVFLTLTFNSFLAPFLGFLEDSDYSIYVTTDWFTSGEQTGSNLIRVLVLIVPLVMAFMVRERMAAIHGRKWEILVNLSIINLAFYIVSLYNWIFARFAIYTSIYNVIMMTYLVQDGFSEPGESNSYYPLSLLLYSVYFYNVAYSVQDYTSDFF